MLWTAPPPARECHGCGAVKAPTIQRSYRVISPRPSFASRFRAGASGLLNSSKSGEPGPVARPLRDNPPKRVGASWNATCVAEFSCRGRFATTRKTARKVASAVARADPFHPKGHRFQSPNQWLRVLINQNPSIANHTSAKMPATRTSRRDNGAPDTIRSTLSSIPSEPGSISRGADGAASNAAISPHLIANDRASRLPGCSST
jgi:hypothetical protein